MSTLSMPVEAVSMIALHGVAASTDEVDQFISPLVERFPTKGVHWVFPKAPCRPVTVLGGRPALAWYDVLAWDRSRMDSEGIEEATCSLNQILEAERLRGVPPERIVLAGFSQGGALALHAGLRLGAALGGIVALSSALPFLKGIPERQGACPPLFLAHGLFDTTIPFSVGQASARLLKLKGYDVQWQSYPIGHWISQTELSDVSRWLQSRVLSRPSAAGPASSAA